MLCVFRDLPRSDHFEMFGWEEGWIARSLALGHGFSSPFQPLSGPTALVAPLYPALLALIFRIFGLYTNASAFVALAFNSLISSLTAIPVFLIARKTFGSDRPTLPRGAAWLWALYPFAIYFSGAYLWDCTLTAFLFAWCFYAALHLRHATPRQWAGFGLLYGLTALNNPSVLTLFPALAGLAALQRWSAVRPFFRRFLLASAALLAVLAPWTVRDLRVMHAPVPLRDGFWLEFWAGNAGDTSTSNPAWAHPASNPAELREYQRLGELRYMQQKHDLAVRYVQHHPAAFALVSTRRVIRFWTGLWSLSPGYRSREPLDLPNLPFCTVLTTLMLFGTGRALRTSKSKALPFVWVFLLFPLPYYLTHASMDYRQPIEPEIAVMVAAGAADVIARVRGRRKARAAVPVAGELVSA